MAIYVNTNVGGIRGRNQLNNVGQKLDVTYQRLSSGLRINSAKDDAAGLAISDRMTAQINGLTQGNRNASDAIALMQTMEGGIDEISNGIQQIRTLAVQAGNGTNTDDDLKAISSQIAQLFLGMQDIAENTKFGGKTILNGFSNTDGDTIGNGSSIFSADATGNATQGKYGGGQITFQIGANGGDTLSLSVESFSADCNAKAAGVPQGTGIRPDNSLGFMAVLANKFAQCCLGLNDNDAATAGKGLLDIEGTTGARKNLNGILDGTDHLGKGKANKGTGASCGIEDLISACDTALAKVDNQRATLGSTMNRLESTMRNQSNVIANQSDARSRIRDTDFAEESAKLSQYNIIQQASQSMLMQANARPQMALSLLG